MLNVVYFLLLAAASVEDYRQHRVSLRWTVSVFLAGLYNCIVKREDRWVTLALTCICMVFLYLLYRVVLAAARHGHPAWRLGGADVKLLPGMMLFQGWDMALAGVFAGLLCAAAHYLLTAERKREIPLVPWMSSGCLLLEVACFLNRTIS